MGESLDHAMLFYRFAKAVWQGLYAKVSHSSSQILIILDSWQEFISVWKNLNACDLILEVGWSLWNNRNTCYVNNVCSTFEAILVKSMKFSDEYKAAQVLVASRSVVHTLVCSAPPPGKTKLNVDASNKCDELKA